MNAPVGIVRSLTPEPPSLIAWRRGLVCQAVAAARGNATGMVDQVAQEFYKSAVSPTSLSATALVPTGTGAFLTSLKPRSASARLFERSTKVGLAGVGQVNLPAMGTALTAAAWVLEGDPAPAGQGTLATVQLGPVKKLMLICALTGELADMGAPAAEAVISVAMQESVAAQLDASVFSNAAVSSARPAGLLNATAPLTATSGGGLAAMVGDLKQLFAAIATAGGGANVMIFAAPAQAIAIAAQATNLDAVVEVVPVPALATGTVVAVEVGAIAYVLDELPRVEASKDALLHMDTVPAQIGTVGSPNVVAAPTRSAWQTDVINLRIILRTNWAIRAPGMVQHIVSTTW